MNYKQLNKSIVVEADILLLPDPPFGTRLIFPQIPLVDCFTMFSVQSSPTWIEKNRTNYIVVAWLEKKLFFCLEPHRINHMDGCKVSVIIVLRIQTTYLRRRDIRMWTSGIPLQIPEFLFLNFHGKIEDIVEDGKCSWARGVR